MPSTATLVRELAPLLRADLPELAEFRAAAARASDEAGFEAAGKALCAYFDARWRLEGPPATPSERARTIAGEALRHEFRFGELTHAFGPSIDWDYDLDYEWRVTLNRLGFLAYLAQVYRFDRDEKVAAEMQALLRSWILACPRAPRKGGRFESWQRWPPALGINWRSLDAAIRVGNLKYVYAHLAGSSAVTTGTRLLVLRSMWEHIDYLKDDDWDGGNWLSLVLDALVTAGTEWTMFDDARAWREAAVPGIARNVLRDIYADGKEIEDSTGYVQFALNHLLDSFLRMRAAGAAFAPDVEERVRKSMDFAAHVAFPNGRMPMIGDADDHTPYVSEKYWRELGRPDVGYLVTAGKEGTPPPSSSRAFPDGGWYVMRSPFGARPFAQALHLVFKASPGGPHGHRDQLALTAYAYGEPLLIDPGRLNYREEGVRVFGGTPYHNTVSVDGASQRHGAARVTRWETTPAYDLVDAEHALYDGVTHRRRVVFLKDACWLVVDSLRSAAPHTYAFPWHFRDGLAPRAEGTRVIAAAPGGPGLALVSAPAMQGRAFEYSIAYQWDAKTPAVGWHSELRASDADVATLLAPFAPGTPPATDLQNLGGEGGALAFRVSLGTRAWDVVLAADGTCRVDARL